jgi:hypothetical protein
MIVYRICGHCKTGYNPQVGETCKCNSRQSRNAQIGEWERPVVWEDPTDPNPETRYRYPAGYDASSNAAMPDYYKKRGFQRKEFATLRDHEKFQRETNTRNYKTWDIKRH